MKKFILSIPLILLIATIPYWTGRVAEQKFPQIQQHLFQKFNLKAVESTYQRGWFHSSAQALVEMSSNRFLIVQEIEHGFLPIKSAKVYTSLQTLSEVEILEVRTQVHINGDMTSTVKIPAQHIKDEQMLLQWQEAQGTVYIKRNFAAIHIEMHYPQVLLETEAGTIVIESMSLNTDMQPSPSHLMIGKSNLNITTIQLNGKEKEPVILKELNFVGSNDLMGENLKVLVKMDLQEVHVGMEHYGPGTTNVELDHWHLPTLLNIQNIVNEIQNQQLSSQQQANMMKFRLIPEGITLLKNTPEFAITDLSLQTPEGEIHGTLQLKVEGDNENIFAFALFNPPIRCFSCMGSLKGITELMVLIEISGSSPRISSNCQLASSILPI